MSTDTSYPHNLKKVRKKQFSRLQDGLFLDHAGSTLYAASQIQSFSKDLQENLYGNPHSGNPSSDITKAIVHQVRCTVLTHFNVTLDDYDIVFCPGSTDALKMVGQYLSWNKGDSFVYLEDNHTSIVGIRELAFEKGSKSYCLTLPRPCSKKSSITPFTLSHYNMQSIKIPQFSQNGSSHDKSLNLFAYSAQSNFSGCRYPLNWIDDVQKNGLPQVEDQETACENKWLVLLDAAAFVSTSKLDLKAHPADFVCISFYKMFGFPTGIGALLVKKESCKYLSRKVYFGGGTANGYLAQSDYFKPREILHERLEDGSLNFLDIIALKYGFDALKKICGPIASVQEHTFALTQRLYRGFQEMRHANGQPVFKIYSHSNFDSRVTQGPIVTFNVTRDDGSYVGFNHVVHLASSRNIHLRAGCFCNVGACSAHLALDPQQLQHVYESGHVCGDSVDLVEGYPVGAVRASLGYMSTQDDVDQFLAFLRECFVQTTTINEIFYDALSEPERQQTDEIVLEKITLYPVKSCQGLDVDEWQISDTGLKYDRNWMVVNEYGVCLTLKRHTKLTQIYPHIDLKRSKLVLRAKGHGSIEVPLDCSRSDSDHVTADFCHTKVCGDRIVGLDCGPVASQWLTQVLGENASLVRKLPDARRQSKRKNGVAQSNGAHEHHLALTNEAQYLLLSRGSLQRIITAMARSDAPEKDEKRMDTDSIAARFRSNFIITGAGAFAEEAWKSISIKTSEGRVTFQCVGLCNRCSMVCIDQATGQRSIEPLRTLGTLPPSEHIVSEVQKIPSKRRNHFGVYLRGSNNVCTVRVGSHVTPVQEESKVKI
uniref:Molybdenum cofactor sulfurase n=1 Tax=Phallusia mammillata TaxID=59560 RepID=A0A6F9DKC6_9ASCI|nr:molybdenum cofactor sulfurase-like [Phallusia mammillata]